MTIPTSGTIITTTTVRLPLGTERFTVLLLGGDAGPGRRGLRTDTIIVASINTLTGDAALFGLPRNMGGLTFSDGTPFPGLNRGLLNEVYTWGWRNPDRFSGTDPGATAVSDVASNLIGIPIDGFVLVEMVGFAEIVDVLGGVTVDVKGNIIAPVYDRVTGGHTMITIPEGNQTFDGDMALAFVRSRTGSNDYDRMARQRCMMTALGGQVEPLSLFTHLPAVLDTIEQSVTTDIPLSKIPYIVNLAPNISSDRMVVVGFDRGYRDGRTEKGLPKPDVAAIRAAVQEALSGNTPEGSNMAMASDACTR
jgi:LCP family protein required for cell wall assembly